MRIYDLDILINVVIDAFEHQTGCKVLEPISDDEIIKLIDEDTTAK